MKKTLCLILSLLMIFTSSSIVLTSYASDYELKGEIDATIENALDSYNPADVVIPDDYYDDIENLIADKNLGSEVNILGLDLNFFYHSSAPLNWSKLNFSTDGSAPDEENPIGYSEIYLAKANINTYLKRLVNKVIDDKNFYKYENAVAITNFIGNALNPNFQGVSYETFKYIFAVEPVSEDVFFETISQYSGLGDVITHNFTGPQGIDYMPLFSLFGLADYDIYPSKVNDGVFIGKQVLKCFFEELSKQGPINFFCDFLYVFTRTYQSVMAPIMTKLFYLHIVDGAVQTNNLYQMTDLLNLISNGCDSTDTSNLQFLTYPIRRFALSKNSTEVFLYMLVYLNLNGMYKNNAAVIDEYKLSIDDAESLSPTDKDRVKTIIGSFFGNKDDLANFMDIATTLLTEEFDYALDNVFTSFTNRIADFINTIVTFFDNFFKFCGTDSF